MKKMIGGSFLNKTKLFFYSIIQNILYVKDNVVNTSTNFINDMKNNPNEMKNMLLYSLIYVGIIALTLIYYNFSNIKNTFSYKSLLIAFVILILSYGSFVYINSKMNSSTITTNNTYIIYLGLLIIGLSIIVPFLFSILSSEKIIFLNLILNFILIIGVIVGLAIVYYILINYLKSRNGFTGFVTNLIFYIPCLLIEFINYVKKELQLTSSVVFILLFLEFLLILCYFFIPRLMKILFKRKGAIKLLDGSNFLFNDAVIANGKKILADKSVFSQNFSLSMWIYLNPQPKNYSSYNKETVLFDYGNGKPKITYFNDESKIDAKDSYYIYFTDTSKNELKYQITLPNQKWNNFVFNYQSNIVDLFINGKLERTFDFSSNDLSPPQYLVTDNITTGSENGIKGAICNIEYFSIPLTKNEIVNNYNVLMWNNPPI